MSLRHLAPAAAAFVVALLVALLGLAANADESTNPPAGDVAGPANADRGEGVVRLRLLGVNDLHGHLEPPRPGIGGAAWLDSHLDRATLPGRTIRVHAGDMVGATPLVSSWFHDESTIEAANLMQFDVGTLGNHEFDEGGDELLRLLNGGRRSGPEALKRDADGNLVNSSSPAFAGVSFPYIAANTYDRDGELLLPPYEIVEREGVKVGFVGVTTTSTPNFLLPRFAQRFRFTDISEAVDRWVPELRERGVEAIVVLAHSGAKMDSGDIDSGAGEILEEARQMSDAVDVVIAGHTHSFLDLRVPNASGDGDKLVVEALSYGVAYDRVDMTIDRASGDVVAKSAQVPPTTHAEAGPDREVQELVAGYVERIGPLARRVVGRSDEPLTRANGRLGELAAAAQRAFAAADLAFVNSGSMRADLDPGPLTYAELFEVHPYEEQLLRMELTGREVLDVLGRGGPPLYVAGARAGGDPVDVTLTDGGPLDPAAIYTVVANELFVTTAGIPALSEAALDAPSVGTEVEALVRAVESSGPR